jgi:septal ring-binding cell division protein DamX
LAGDSFDDTSERALRYVRQLGEWAHRILLVTGPRGTGRSALFQLLSNHVAPGSCAARVNAAAQRQPLDVWRAIAFGLGIEMTRSAEQADIAAKILAHSRGLAEAGHLDVVLIDNADHLPDSVVQSLLELMEKSLPFDSFRLVLFGDEPFAEGFGRMISIFGREVGWHHTPLTPETLAATERHLTQGRSRADREPEPDPDVEALGPTAASISRRRLPWIHLALAGVITLVLLAVWFDFDWILPGEEDLGDVPTPLAVLQARDAASEQEEVTAAEPRTAPNAETIPIPIERTTVESEQVAAVENPKEAASSEPAEPTEVAEVESASAGVAPRTEEKLGADEPTIVPELAITDAPAETASPTARESAAPSRQIVETSSHGPAWIMQQRPDAFVLQLFGVSSRESLERFLKAEAPGEPFAYFETRRGGSPWFVVLYGVYRDRERAAAAAGKLPSRFGDEPWIRSFGDVQKEVAAAR